MDQAHAVTVGCAMDKRRQAPGGDSHDNDADKHTEERPAGLGGNYT
ncbi:hypothetical protein PI124_g20969 [Phytophthora idaei]|nr:hypothetical protein PI125_g22497 [Phytophthora idaei]KAG3135235.1 hypothetical protein PI126_g18341 [Phytophthora idaei]KAG3233973.1 hypothetical protein PI124_g20969 [Phytophthora idaei]